MVYIIAFGCDNKKEDQHIVAKWNDVSISLSDFERVYFNSWQFKGMADSPETRRKIARELLEKEIVVREYEKGNVIDESLYDQKLRRDLESILRRRYLEVTIKDTLTKPTEKELKELLIKSNISVKVKQIFTKNEKEIKNLYQRLQQGAKFEDIAAQYPYNPSTVLEDGSVGWVKWDDVDMNVEKVLFSLKQNQISEPVKSLGGWHILKADSIRTTIQFNTDTDDYTLIDLKHKVVNRKLEIAGAKHIRDIVWTKKLAINAKLFKKVWNFVSPKLPSSKQEIMLNGYNELEMSSVPEDLGKEIIAKVDDVDFTVNDFLYALPGLSRDLLKPNLRWAIEVAIRNKIITEAAIENGFAEDPVVLEKYRRAELSYKYYAAMVAADTTEKHKVDLQAYYEKNKDKYIDFIESEIEQVVVEDRSLALEIAKKIYSGEGFEKFQKEYRKAGNLFESTLVVSSMDNPLGKKAAELPEGEIFAPIQTEKGYHIIRVKHKTNHYLPYDKIKTKLAKAAQADYYDLLHEGLLASNYDAKDIEYSNENLSIAFTKLSNTIF